VGSSTYRVVTFEINARFEEQLAEVLSAHGLVGCELRAMDEGRLEATVPLSESGVPPARCLLDELGALACSDVLMSERPVRDWVAGFRESARAFALGRTWWIDPDPDSLSSAPDGRVRLVIEPRMAFGTGSHASTRLVLLELEDDPPQHRRVLDVGSGSGILCLASEMLGASWAVGLDIDLQAVFVARDVAADQDPPSNPAYFAGPLQAVTGARFDLVLCNMLSSEFTPLLRAVRQLLDKQGEAVFSGILAAECTLVEGNLEEAGFAVVRSRRQDEWMALRARAK